ncbi:Trafficking protein particle complex subunit 12 [Entomortierella chlamydospora]|uniref:Trafficking protein particle complex subunit 12 n=1 Tax=Entomortierella chlamydospora TaxID=101097 RepID=A0A9P6T4N3_9FUNG|nr:Trafficking protein particle complex subunit 12 [Entomortierella chlamydospora]
MSRNVPFEDPLLHPPTPPSNTEVPTKPQEQELSQGRSSPQYDDGPIPFSTGSSAEGPSVFTPPPFPPRPIANTALATPVEVGAASNTTEAGVATAGFVDPLSAALDSHEHDEYPKAPTEGKSGGDKTTSPQGSSPSINTSTINNSMPSDFPTHLASPPIPHRPTSASGAPFTSFHSALPGPQPETPTSISVSESSAPTVGGVPISSLDSMSNANPKQPPAVGLGFDQPGSVQKDGSTIGQQWTKRQSIGVTTNPSGVRMQDHSDMVRQDLKSPELENPARNLLYGSPSNNPLSGATYPTGESNSQLHITPIGHGRDHSSGIRSPVFAMPQSPMRKEGFPILNSHNMFHEITSTDTMNDIMVKHIPADQRTLRDWRALTEAEQRQASRAEILHELTINNSWRAMTRYTRTQILATPPEQTTELINLWYARLLALVKIGQYEMAQAELEQLGDLWGPQYRYENYPPDMFPGNEFQTKEQQQNSTMRRGSMVPFELFVLKARLQGYLGDSYEAIDQLYSLIMYCKKHGAICRVNEDNIGAQQWHDLTGQLHLMILNYLVELNDYSSATKHGRDLAKAYPQDINFHSGLGRLYLQLGDIERAEEVFKEVEEMVKNHNSETEKAHFKLQLSMNRALLAVTQGQWQVAKSAFEDVLVQEPENLAASNNLVVCELYAGQLNEAIPRLERLMFAYPTSAGTSEPLVFNMATLYELRTEGSLKKKQQMMVEVCKWAGDQFNVGVFKV